MHKIFARTQIVGKKIIYLPECHSTNTILMKYAKEGVENGTFVYTDYQTNGRGQRGNSWDSTKGQNLLCSILLREVKLELQNAFFLNIIVGLAIYDALTYFQIPVYKLKIKWPNDLYILDKKIAGTLIENSLLSNKLDFTIVGIGLNINQVHALPASATSLKLETGLYLDSLEIAAAISYNIERYLLTARSELMQAYYNRLYWIGEVHMFQDMKGEVFSGEIDGLDNYGRLSLKTEKGNRYYDVKEIKFLH